MIAVGIIATRIAARIGAGLAVGYVCAGLAVTAASPSVAAELVMFEERGCPWCARWHAEIGVAYPKTDAGRQAPLRVVDVDVSRPADLRFISGIRATPTFVLVDQGAEIGRITGYPGADFFWGLLERLLARLPAVPQPPPGQRSTKREPAPSRAEAPFPSVAVHPASAAIATARAAMAWDGKDGVR